MEEYSHVSFAGLTPTSYPKASYLISDSDNYSSIEEESHDCSNIHTSLGYAYNDPHASLRPWVMCDNNYNGKINIKSESLASCESHERFSNCENQSYENYLDTDSKGHVNFVTVNDGSMLPTFFNSETYLTGLGNTAKVLPVFPHLTKGSNVNGIPIMQNNVQPLMRAVRLQFSTEPIAEQPDSNQVKDFCPVNEQDDSMCPSTSASHQRNKDLESEIKRGVGVDITEIKSRDEPKRKSDSIEWVTSTKMDTNADEDKSKRRKCNGTANNSSGKSTEATVSRDSKNPKTPKSDFIHVRARRGQATDSHSLAERIRREKISERMKYLQDLVPGCNKVTGKAVMLDEVINYVRSLQRQVEFLSMKLAAVSTRVEFNVDNIFGREVCFSNSIEQPTFFVHATSTWT